MPSCARSRGSTAPPSPPPPGSRRGGCSAARRPSGARPATPRWRPPIARRCWPSPIRPWACCRASTTRTGLTPAGSGAATTWACAPATGWAARSPSAPRTVRKRRPERAAAGLCGGGSHAGRGRRPLSDGGPSARLAVGLVLEGDLQLRPVGDPAVVFEVYVLPDHLGDADVADGLAHGPHRFRRGFLPRAAARPDDVDDLVHTHDGLLHGWAAARCAGYPASLCIRR